MSLKRTYLVKHLVAFVQNEGLDVAKGEHLVSDKGVESARCSNDDIWVGLFVLEQIDVFLNRCAAVEDRGLDVREVLAEASVFVLDLVGELSSMAHDQDGGFSRNGLELMQGGEDKDCSLSQTRLRLAENIKGEHGVGNAYLLDCRGADVRLVPIKFCENVHNIANVRPSP